MPRLIRWAEHEIYTAIPAFIFFLLTFNLLHYSCVLLLGPDHVRFTSYLGATIGAVFAAKIIIIVRNLPYINAFPHKPLIYNISWKLLIYGFFVLLVQILDFLFRRMFHHETLILAIQQLQVELTNPLFWGTQILILFLFLIYLTLSELGRVLGPKQFRKMMLGY